MLPHLNHKISEQFYHSHFLCYCLIVFITVLGISHAKAYDSALTSIQHNEITRAPVTLDGHTLFYVRGITSFPAEKRAEMIQNRITNLAENKNFNTNSITLNELEDRTEIVGNGVAIVYIYDEDARLEGVQRQALVMLIEKNVIDAIHRYRYERSPGVLLEKSFYAGCSLVLLIILLYLIKRISLFASTALEAKIKPKIEGFETQSYKLIQSRQLWGAVRGFFNSIKFILIFLLIFFWLQFVLNLYPLTKPFAKNLSDLFIDPLEKIGLAFLERLPNFIFLIVLFFVFRYLLKLIKLFFLGVDRGTITLTKFDPEWTWPTYKLVRIFTIIAGVVIAYPYIPGSDSEAFQGISVLIGLMISLGSSSFIANLIAGFSLMYRKAFRVGDRIFIDEILGDVIETKQIITRIRSVKNEEIIIPNSALVNKNIINYSSLARTYGLILHTNVTVGYDVSWRLVEEMLKTAATKTEGLLKEPPPFVFQKSLENFGIVYEINAFTYEPHRMFFLYTALHQNILDIFNEHSVQIMTPAYEGDPDEPKVVSKEKWFVNNNPGKKS